MIHSRMKLYGCALKGVSKITKNGQFLILYGQFRIGNKNSSKSNYLFDNSLRMQNDLWGLSILRKLVKNLEKMAFSIILIC